jgi:SEL1 protein
MQGDPVAQYGLGMLYLLGTSEFPRDKGKAVVQFKLSAEQNHSPSQVALAKIYLEQNEILTATRFLELAARQQEIEAFYYLAELNLKGIGKDASCGMAAAYYKLVVERVGLDSSVEEANVAWRDGRVSDALVLYMLSAEQGYESSQANVAYILDSSPPSFDVD